MWRKIRYEYIFPTIFEPILTLRIASTFALLAVSEAVYYRALKPTGRLLSLPVIVTALWVRNVEKEHAEHEAHLRHENDGKLPEPPAYEYLNVRRTYYHCLGLTSVCSCSGTDRPFPWGMNSLFFNPHVSVAVPSYRPL